VVCLPGLQYSMCTLCRYRSVLSSSPVCAPLCREPISSLNVPTSTNEAYELVKQVRERGKGGMGGGGASGSGEEEGYEYVVVSAHPPAQPVTAGEGVYEYIP